MPPQDELHSWGLVGPLAVEDDVSVMDFDVFMNVNYEDSPLFDLDLDLPDCDPSDLMMDLCGSLSANGDVRHDCMWAGTCNEHSKERLVTRPDPLERLHPSSPVKKADPITVVHQTSLQQSRVKCSQRSLLKRTNLCCVSDESRTAPQEDSDDSGRPETPQSLSHSEPEPEPEEDSNDIKDSCNFRFSIGDDAADLASSSYQEEEEDEDEEEEEEEEEEEDDDDEDEEDCEDDGEECKALFPVSEVTGQKFQTSRNNFSVKPQHTPSTAHFFNDHSYHLSKNDVSMSIPGNLTPSDSEDEIDVVSVSGEKGSSCGGRSSSQGVLPTNPSARDRHALQQSMASVAKRKAFSTSYGSSFPQPSGKLARMQVERQRQRDRKRRAQERAKQYKSKRGGLHTKASSSDSEPDSCEKRSLHNNMERQRRVDLRNAFEDLRLNVPVLHQNQRAAKVVILKEASHFCHQLTADSRSLQQETNAMERERDRLLAKVSFLRKQLAMQRCQR